MIAKRLIGIQVSENEERDGNFQSLELTPPISRKWWLDHFGPPELDTEVIDPNYRGQKDAKVLMKEAREMRKLSKHLAARVRNWELMKKRDLKRLTRAPSEMVWNQQFCIAYIYAYICLCVGFHSFKKITLYD